MQRLIASGLMFGNLVHVASPVLVARYNRALKHLIGRETALTDFYIDISGFSPEVGVELGDPLYLNHNGVNRQFILLTTEQKSAPLLDATFSTTRAALRDFIEDNEAQLFALTARDAVAGELVNSVFAATTPAKLLDIRRLEVEADTTRGTVRNAQALAEKVTRFKQEEDAWFDDVLIAEMITLAAETGDVVRNPVRLKTRKAPHADFWTSHFGGLYVFRDTAQSAVLAVAPTDDIAQMPVDMVMGLDQTNRVARFLNDNGLVEPIVRARGIDSAAILRQKMDFILVNAAARAGMDLSGATRGDLRRLARHHISALPPAWHGLSALVDWASGDGPWPRVSSDHPAYFYSLRAADTPQRDLVNRLLAELAPMDVRQLFICHKELFYRLYAQWPETKRAYVVDFLAREYQVDKAGARDALFGHEAEMRDDDAPPPRDDLISRVGPWGAVRRS